MGKTVFESDPEQLVNKVIELIEADEKLLTPEDYRASVHRARG